MAPEGDQKGARQASRGRAQDSPAATCRTRPRDRHRSPRTPGAVRRSRRARWASNCPPTHSCSPQRRMARPSSARTRVTQRYERLAERLGHRNHIPQAPPLLRHRADRRWSRPAHGRRPAGARWRRDDHTEDVHGVGVGGRSARCTRAWSGHAAAARRAREGRASPDHAAVSLRGCGRRSRRPGDRREHCPSDPSFRHPPTLPSRTVYLSQRRSGRYCSRATGDWWSAWVGIDCASSTRYLPPRRRVNERRPSRAATCCLIS